MAAAVVIINGMNSDSESKEKRKYLNRQKINQSNDKLVLNSRNDDDKLGMGFMTYKLNTEYGIEVSKFKIIQASYQIDDIYQKLEEYIFSQINNRHSSDILVYQIIGINPSLVSYDIITSSNFPFVKINIKSYGTQLFHINGDKTLSTTIYQKIPNLSTYRKYHNRIMTLNKKDLSEIYVETIGKTVPKIFPKYKMRTRLLNYKKQTIFVGKY